MAHRTVLKGKTYLGSTSFSSVLHHVLPLAKPLPAAVLAHQSKVCSNCFHFPNHISSI